MIRVKKLLILMMISVGFIVSSSSAMDNGSELKNLALRYINFINQVSPSSGHVEVFSIMESLFSSDCQKVANGKLICNDIKELEEQLRTAQVKLKEWTVKPYQKNCIPFPENNTYVLQFEVETSPHLIVIKYLTFNDSGLITNINEVFHCKEGDDCSCETQEANQEPHLDSSSLKKAGSDYVELLEHFGNIHCEEAHPSIYNFSSNCLKLINGKIVSRSHVELTQQLHEAKENFGSWEIELDQKSIIANPQENVCMVRYNITPSKYKTTHTVMAYLKFDRDGKIQEINEVYAY